MTPQKYETHTKKPLKLKQTRNSRVCKQSPTVDLSCRSMTRFKRAALFTALALGLISKPYLAHAETNAVVSYLQGVANLYATEVGNVGAENQWIRMDFSNTYIDPVVVVEGSIANASNAYIVGIRNVDAMGFEISLKNCANSTAIPAQENVHYSVIEKSQLPSTDGSVDEVRQQFLWGECPDAAITTEAVS